MSWLSNSAHCQNVDRTSGGLGRCDRERDGDITLTTAQAGLPASILGMIVSVEAVVLSSFILMRQNRMSKRAERRDHLNVQVDLISEKEITKLLQMVRAICERMGLKHIADDKELKEFSQTTSVETLTQRLEDTLPDE